MVFDVLAVMILVAAFLRARQLRSPDPQGMPLDDRPPAEAFGPLPPRIRRRRYVGDGLAEIDDFLAGRDQTA